MAVIFSLPPFYSMFVGPSDTNRVLSKIQSNSNFWPYFKDTIGAIDGSHIPAMPPIKIAFAFWDCKGNLSQNCLFVCDFNLHFTYVLTKWEGSASDICVYANALMHDLQVPDGKYLFADLGFLSWLSLLVLYHSVQYHLAEWGWANVQ